MSEVTNYAPIPDDVRLSPVGCPVLSDIPAPFELQKPWRQPLLEQPKGRLHKSVRNMTTQVTGVALKDQSTAYAVHKEPYGRNGIQVPVTIVRFR